MSTSPVDTVTTFLRSWNNGIDAVRQSLYDYLAPDCVWENVGMTRTVGPRAADECFFSFEPMQNCSRIDVRILAIAAQGDTVLTERDERVIGKDGRKTLAVRSMGSFVVKDGKFTEWRDYFMPVPHAGQAGAGTSTSSGS